MIGSIPIPNTRFYLTSIDGKKWFITEYYRTAPFNPAKETYDLFDILPTAKVGGFLHQPPLHSNRGCCVLHDVRQALLPVCPTVRYGLV